MKGTRTSLSEAMHQKQYKATGMSSIVIMKANWQQNIALIETILKGDKYIPFKNAMEKRTLNHRKLISGCHGSKLATKYVDTPSTFIKGQVSPSKILHCKQIVTNGVLSVVAMTTMLLFSGR